MGAYGIRILLEKFKVNFVEMLNTDLMYSWLSLIPYRRDDKKCSICPEFELWKV